MPNFFGRPFSAKQKKPNDKKNFFQNYNDHLQYLQVDLAEKLLAKHPRGSHDLLAALMDEILSLKHLTMFDGLRDGYDYFDEVMGASVVPLLGVGAMVGSVGLAIWEGIQALAIKMNLQENDYGQHGDKALTCLVVAGASLVLSAAIFLKSVIGLVTRPIVTAIQGWKPQDEERFYNEDSWESTATKEIARLFTI
ncbi:hypothetical protein [Legionella nagasakiensis]|uniref:hypothetical protein n=1 Tax=Legionella nagasakiensis TaxID=535290 RepID=UPI0010549F95|nr:hypothetical protein [Legionella nagasakiensis]